MMNIPKVIIFFAIYGVCVVLGAVRMPAHFGDDMVMQWNSHYGARAFLNGFADPQEKVTIVNGHTTYHTVADDNGDWSIQLRAPKGNITVSGQNGPSVTAHNILAGDVFFCSGQSNMVFPMSLTLNATEEIADAANWPNFRLFTVPLDMASTEQKDINISKAKHGQGKWIKSTPANIRDFSAVCFMAVREIARQYTKNAPMGLIFSAWGGTRIEAWMSSQAISQCEPEFPVPKRNKQNAKSVLWNAMVAPFSPIAIRAALWYQGEANANQGLKWNTSYSTDYYGCMLQTMITDWRDRKGMGDFAFGAVQLPPSVAPEAGDIKRTGRQEVRAATALIQPHPDGLIDISGMAVTIDLGGSSAWGYDHPPNKNEIARRLGLAMLHAAYALQADQLHFSGPILQTVHIQVPQSSMGQGGAIIELGFNSTSASGLKFSPVFNCTTCCSVNNTNTFETSVDGGNAWLPVLLSDVKIDVKRSTLQIHVDSTKTTQIRYAWTDFVNCVLQNSDKLPLAPFSRTVIRESNFPLRTLSSYQSPLSVPPMGFNSWNYYHCNIDENIIKSLADAMSSNGMRQVGYSYINIDDCWQVGRNASGAIIADPSRFPSGMKAVADYVHSKGMKFGVYTARGSRTCQGRPGSYKYEMIDAATYCEWGLDYLKNDNCGGTNWPAENTSWINFKEGFDKCYERTGRYTVRSIEYCKDPATCGQWIGNLANLWRTTGDVQATWQSVMGNLHLNNKMAPIARPGAYNDPDMLQVGNVGLSQTEQQSHFSMWCIVGAPLLAGTDLIHASNETLAILTNPEVIAINQDSGLHNAVQGTLVVTTDNAEVWSKPLSDANSIAVALLNRGDTTELITAKWTDLGLTKSQQCVVRDLWKKKDLGTYSGNFSTQVPSHGVVMLKLTKQSYNPSM